MVSNLKKGYNVVTKYLYYATSIDILKNDIEYMTYDEFNVKYNTNFASDYNFMKSIYRIFNTYFKYAKKKSLEAFYRDEIKKAYQNRLVVKIIVPDWDKMITSIFPLMFQNERVIVYSKKHPKAYFGYYLKLGFFLEDMLNNMGDFEDYFCRLIEALAEYFRCIKTDKSFSYQFKDHEGMIQIKFCYTNVGITSEHEVMTKPLSYYYDSKKSKYTIRGFNDSIKVLFPKESESNKDETAYKRHHKDEYYPTPDFDEPQQTFLAYGLLFSYGIEQNNFDVRAGEVGMRKSVYLRY